jgi:hypothetical protein
MRECIKPGDIIISGGARGADAMAKRWADENGFEIVEHIPDWARDPMGAGFARNRVIIADCDHCIAFWDGKSTGTEHDIRLCRQHRKPVRIEYFRPASKGDDELSDLFE